MEAQEKVLFSNSFGSVTDKRIILNYKSGTEDLPLGQITSVSYQHSRNYFFAIGGFALGLIVLLATLTNLHNIGSSEVLIVLIFVIIAILSGVANWIGHHNILISAGGKDRKPLKAEMSKTRQGREFADAVKRAVIK